MAPPLKRLSVGVLFGGRSLEHEISVITALQSIEAIDPFRYHVVPIYVAQSGKWYTGEALLHKAFYQRLPENFSQAKEVLLLPDPTIQGIVSVTRGRKVLLHQKIPLDVCLLGFHGQQGEDGCVQGLLELAGIPYAGCGVAASAVTMDKYLCKSVLKAHGIPTLPDFLARREQALSDFSQLCDQICKTPGLEVFPLFVKPCHLGSSFGIAVAHDRQGLQAALAKAFQYDNEVIIEPYIQELMEINVAVLDGDPPRASVVEVPIPSGSGALSFEDKYLRGGSKTAAPRQEGMASLQRVIDPVDLPQVIKEQVTAYALQAFSLLRCRGVSRLDFMWDKKREALYFNELNPIPGSLAFYLWEKSHPPLLYTEVIAQMIDRAFHHKALSLAPQKLAQFRALKSL